MSDSTTNVTETDVDIDLLLQQPGAENIMLPSEKKTEEKPSFFSNKKTDLTFLDNQDDEAGSEGAEGAAKNPAQAAAATAKGSEILDNLDPEATATLAEETEEEKTKKGGRPTGLVELTTKLIEKGTLIPFEGEEDISKYSLKDFEELYEMNEKEKEKRLYNQVSSEFFDNLPEDLQKAAAYVANGGRNLKGFFRVLADVNETRELDLSTEEGQEATVRQYLASTKFGTPEEIEEQLQEWKDMPGTLEKKANNFKPKLEALKEQQIAATLEQQERAVKLQQAQAQKYMENVYKVLDASELNGVKLDKKVQNMLYAGLVNPAYPSKSGHNTNLLGHLLEKYQWEEPRHDLIAEALWLLADPEGYKNKVKETAKKEQVTETVRQLKTAEKNKLASYSNEDDEARGQQGKVKGLPRPGANFFKR